MLLFSNLPHNCSEVELRKFIESRGIRAHSVRIVRDTVSSTSPSFGEVELRREITTARALACLDGLHIGNRVVHVRQMAAPRPS